MRIGLGIGIPQFQGNGSSGIAASINFAQLVTGDVPSGWTFTRSTSGTYFDASGVLQLASTNVLRISRDPVSGELGYLAEPSRTNSLIQTVWPGGGSTPTGWTDLLSTGSRSAVASLLGSADGASAYTFTAAAQRAVFYQSFSLANNTTYVYSVMVESVTGTVSIADIITPSNLPSGCAVTGAFKNGVAASTSDAVSVGVVAVTIGGTYTGASAVFRVGIGCAANATGTVVLSRPQLEAGAYPTSYIPTTTVAVSRGADLLTTTLSAAHAAALSVAGTMVARFTSYNDDSTNLYVVASVYTSTAAEHTIYRYKSWHGSRTIDSGTQYDQQATASSGVPHKFAHAWEVDNCRGASDGTLTAADAAPSTMPAVTTVGIGARSGGTNQPIGLIHSFALYTSRLTDAQLQALTA